MEERTSFSIRTWAEGDRPREKLMLKGKTVLSDAELIAILIGSGSTEKSAVELSKDILNRAGNKLNELGRLSVNQLMEFKGIGEAKAISIVAALELGRRRRGEEAIKRNKITSSNSAFEILQPILGDLDHEEFWIIYLNNGSRILHKMQLSKGGMTSTVVDVRLVYKIALEFGATSILLAHNHPSGNLAPSESDKRLTKRMKMAGESLDIKVIDHLIVTQSEFFSFADEDLL